MNNMSIYSHVGLGLLTVLICIVLIQIVVYAASYTLKTFESFELPSSTVFLLAKNCVELYTEVNFGGTMTCLPLGHYFDPASLQPFLAAKSIRVQSGNLLQVFGKGGEDWSSNMQNEYPLWTLPFDIKEIVIVKTDLVGSPGDPPLPWETHEQIEDVPVSADLSNIVAISPGSADGEAAGRWPYPVKQGMFSVLNNTLRLQGSDVTLPVSKVAIGTSSAAGQLHVKQGDVSHLSGLLIEGADQKRFSLSYNGTGLGVYEDAITQRLIFANGGNIGIGVANPVTSVHLAGDLRVDGNFSVNGSVTTINSIATLTHMLEILNDGTGPAVQIRQTGATPTLEVYDDTVLVLRIADGGYMGINNGSPTEWLDVSGNINSSGWQKAAFMYARSSPVISNGNLTPSLSGAFVGFNRTGTDGSTLLANNRGTLTGGWEFVSYAGSGILNKVSFQISDIGDFVSYGNYASITGSLFVGSNTYLYGTTTTFQPVIHTGTASNICGPHQYVTYGSDPVPSFQQLNWAHDNLSLNFDGYFDGSSWRYATNTSAFQLAKLNNVMYLRPSTSTGTATLPLTWSGAGITMLASGYVGINAVPSKMLDVGGDANIQNNLTILQSASVTGNLTVGSTITSTVLNVTGNYASIAGNVNVSTSLNVGSMLTAQLLQVTGTYSSFAGQVYIGTFLQIAGATSVAGNLQVGSSATVTGFLNVGSSISVGSAMSLSSDFRSGGSGTILGSLAVGSSMTLAGSLSVGSNIVIGSSLAVGTDIRIGGQATILGNIWIGSSATVTQNLNVFGNQTVSGNLNILSSASISGNLNIGSYLTCGSGVTATCLSIVGPYASISGNLWVGTDLKVLNNASVTGTLGALGGFKVGTVQVIDSHGSVLTGVTGGGGITSATITGSYLTIAYDATVAGTVYAGTDVISGRNITAASTITGTVLNVTGAYASVSGLFVNNVFGNLLLRGYDETGTYKYTTLSAGQPLPAPFLARAISSTVLGAMSLTSATVGSLASQYSMKITGYVQPPVTGTYTFRFTYKDGATVWFGPDKLLDSWSYLNAASVTSTNLIMRASMWTPIIVEHACAASAEKFMIEWSTDSVTYKVLQHSTDGSNFQLAYDLYDTSPAVLGTTFISGKSFFGDESIFSSGISLPNSLLFSGNTSELVNDAGFLSSTPATLTGQAMYVSSFASISGTVTAAGGSFTALSVAGSSRLTGAVDVLSSASQIRLLPTTGTAESSVAFYRNAGKTVSAAGDLWTLGNSVAGQTAGKFSVSVNSTTGLFLTPTGSLGISQNTPTAMLDVAGAANFAGSLTVNGAFSMTTAVGSSNLYTSNAVVAAGSVVVGNSATTTGLAVDLYPGVDNKSKCGLSTSRWTGVYGYALDIAGNALLTGSLTLGGTNIKQYQSIPLTVTPTNPDIPAINPDAISSLLVYEDGSASTLSTGSLSGTAIYGTTTYSTTRCVQLTSTVSSTTGGVSWALNPGNAWVMTAETYVGGGNGGELLGFFAYSSSATGPGSGYAFVQDEYSNINNGNTSSQFSLLYNGVAVNTVPGTANGGTFLIPLAQWNTVKIIFSRNNIRFYVNNVLAYNYHDTSRTTTGDNTYYCGFWGQCTTNNNYHAVRNVKITKYTDGVWTNTNMNSNDIAYVGGRVGINTVSPDVPLSVAVNETVVSNNGVVLSLKANNAVGGTLSTTGRDVGLSFAQNNVNSYGIVQRAGSSTTGNAGRLAFVQNLNSGAAGTEQMCIQQNGFVGINTTFPSYTLHTEGNVAFAILTDNISMGNNQMGFMKKLGFPNSLCAASDLNLILGHISNPSTAGGIFGSNSTATLSQQLVITPTGFVGINTITPSYTLEVSGSGRFSTSLTTSTLSVSNTASVGTLTASFVYASTTAGTSTNPVLTMSAGTSSVNCIPTTQAGAYNPLISAGDSLLYFTQGSVGTGNLVIAPWSNSSFGLRLTSTGNVGVNTASPAFTLDITGAARATGSITAGGRLYLVDATAGSTNMIWGHVVGDGSGDFHLYDQANSRAAFSYYKTGNKVCLTQAGGGSVGINTSAPAFALDVNGTGRFAGSLTVINSSAPVMYLYSTGNNTRLNIDAAYANQAGISFQSAGVEQAVLYRPSSGSNVSMYTPGGGNVMTWTQGGLVGIGNISPSYTLDVSGQGRFSGVYLNNTTPGSGTGGQGTYIGWNRNSPSGTAFFANQIGGGTVGGFEFVNYTNAGAVANQPFNILGNGYVGINNTSPSYQLDVSGTARVTGQLTVNNIVVSNLQIKWDSTNGIQIYDVYNNTILLYQGSTSASAIRTNNNILDNGAGNAKFAGTVTALQYTGQTTTQVTNDTLYFGPAGGGNVFLDRPVATGSFIFNYNTPVTATQNTTFQVYNGSTSRSVLLGVASAGSSSGSNYVFVTSLSVGQSSAPSYTLDVNGTMRATGVGIVNNASIGDVGYGSAWAGFAHTSMFSQGNYAILQGNTGQLLLNAPSTTDIRFCLSNAQQGAWNSTGLGIGNTSPSYKLDVSGSARVSSQMSINSAAITAALNVAPSGNTDPSVNGIYVYNPTNSTGNKAICAVRTAGASAGSPFFSMDIAGVGGWSMGNDNADSQKFKIKQDWGFASNDRLTISGSNVGINTTSPGYNLDIYGTAKCGSLTSIPATGGVALVCAGPLAICNGINDSSRFISALDNSMTSGSIKYICFGQSSSNGNQAELTFTYTGSNSAANSLGLGFYNSHPLVITNNNFVGINTSSPAYNLDVNGVTRLNGALMSSSLNMAQNTIYLSNNGDTNHGLRYNSTVDGPQLNGFSGGQLCYGTGFSGTALSWNNAGAVTVKSLYVNSAGGASGSLVQGDITGNYGYMTIQHRQLDMIKVSTYGNNTVRQIDMLAPTYCTFIDATNQATLHGGVNVTALAGTGNRAVYSDSNGYLTNSSSDGRMKQDVESLATALNTVSQLRPVSFNWNTQFCKLDGSGTENLQERLGKQRELGFIAQEVRPLVPEVVNTNDDSTLSVDYAKLVPVLTKAVQELNDKIAQQQATIDMLVSAVAALQAT